MPDIAVLRIAVCAPLPGLFDYLPPADDVGVDLRRGLRVKVPFGRGSRVGFIWELAGSSDVPPQRLKAVLSVVDREVLLPDADLKLLNWVADYYHHPLGEVLNTALPVGLRREGPGGVGRQALFWRLTDAGRAVEPESIARAPRQIEVLSCLREAPDGLSAERIKDRLGPCGPVLKRLRELGWVENCQKPAPGTAARSAAPELNAQQRSAVSSVEQALGGFQAFLLDGVTGSGKTEVYQSLIKTVLGQGGQVLLLVPEIGLTPQLLDRLQGRLDEPVAQLHSGMADGERSRVWRQVRDGHAGVLVGTRSAVFTPMSRLALVLVDEEHDLSFKQQDGLRYSARDVAVRRAQQRGCPILLGSATPALESLQNVAQGRYQLLKMTERAGSAASPRMDLIDIRAVRLQTGLSPALIRLLRENIAAGGQSLLFLNRRGYAPILTCHDCGWVAGCPSCDARLTLHQASQTLWCHHCGYSHPRVQNCPACGKPDLLALGQGTERLEAELTQLFPDVPLARVDRDSTRRKGSLQQLLEGARSGKYPLLLGTQMLAKGHHFPNVTLVGILDLDQGLYGADYRAAERMAQLLIQVAGRAGRAERPGRVVLQTRHPDHPQLQTLIHQGYPAFAREAMEERKLALLPPYSAQALLRAEAPDAEKPQVFLDQAVALTDGETHGVQFWGPVPAPMERRAGRFRAHLLLQAENRPTLQIFLKGWLPRVYQLKSARRVRWSLDVDPQEVL